VTIVHGVVSKRLVVALAPQRRIGTAIGTQARRHIRANNSTVASTAAWQFAVRPNAQPCTSSHNVGLLHSDFELRVHWSVYQRLQVVGCRHAAGPRRCGHDGCGRAHIQCHKVLSKLGLGVTDAIAWGQLHVECASGVAAHSNVCSSRRSKGCKRHHARTGQVHTIVGQSHDVTVQAARLDACAHLQLCVCVADSIDNIKANPLIGVDGQRGLVLSIDKVHSRDAG